MRGHTVTVLWLLAWGCAGDPDPARDASLRDALSERIDGGAEVDAGSSGDAARDGAGLDASVPEGDSGSPIDAALDASDGDDIASDRSLDPPDAGPRGDDRFGAPPLFSGGEQWVEDPFVGVRLIHRTTTAPRPLSYHLALVDPRAPGVSFTTTADNGDVPRETTRRTTRGFVADVGAQVGINAHFFTPWPPVDDHSELLGLGISDGDVVSVFEPGWDVGLAISAAGEARVVRWSSGDVTGVATTPSMIIDDAVGAQEAVVTAGANTATWVELHPRTGIGVTAAGIVVMMIVDGRQPGVSEGMTTPEMADVMIELGVIDAINLDGGGSTTLVVADPTPRVVNHPVGLGLPDTERTNGSNLAVFASPY